MTGKLQEIVSRLLQEHGGGEPYFDKLEMRLLEARGGQVTRTRVIYDGSPAKAARVESIYRYYDHHSAEQAR